MKKELLGQALIKFASGVALVMLLTFLPAGTFSFWQAWLLCGVLFIPMLAAGIVMLQKAPDLLAKRLNLKERQGEQKTVVALSGLLFIVMFVLAGLGRRFGWFMLPPAVSWIAAVVFLLGYALFGEVLRENAYLSRTVEVQKGQTVIDTGLYGIVRHPMYSATLLLFLSMPLILGSLFSFLVMLGYVPVIVLRIRNEESVLTEGLPGYADYKTRIKYRLIPFIW